MIKKYSDILSSIFFLLFSLVMLIYSFNIETLVVSQMGPDFFPKVVALAILVISLFHLINSLRNLKFNEVKKIEWHKYKKTLISISLLIGYIFSLNIVGFLIATTAYLFIQIIVLLEKIEMKAIFFYILLSLTTSYLVFFLFNNILNLFLPSGMF